jgi:hypothetical protein
MSRMLLLCVLAPALAPSGLHGVVTRGPTTPVCVAGKPCSAPAQGVVLVFSRNGHGAGRARTDASGRYRVTLAPGTYAVRLGGSSLGGIERLQPTRATVRRGVVARLAFSIDTGIR